jgi:hypothetical protein
MEIKETDNDHPENTDMMYVPMREFYKRIKNQWIKDDSVEEESFTDLSYLVEAAFQRKSRTTKNNQDKTLVCNLEQSCIKRPESGVCDSIQNAQSEIANIRKKYALDELQKRMAMTQKELEEWIKAQLLKVSKTTLALERLQNVDNKRASILAYHIGKRYIDDNKNVQTYSPYTSLFQRIMEQTDFYKKQSDLVRLVKSGFVRKAMVEELSEDSHWLYCTKTNVKVLPVFLYELALEFVIKGEDAYQQKLRQLSQFHVRSDDGDAIVDKYSGYEISKIEFVIEELYDDDGFKIQTGSVLDTTDKDLFDSNDLNDYQENSNEDTNPPDVFDTPKVNTGDLEPQHMMIKNIFLTYCRVLQIPVKEYEQGLQEFVNRVSQEIVQQSLLSRDEFTAKQSKKVDPSKIPELYQRYYHQFIIIITTAVFFMGMQIQIPRIQAKKTVPGCVRSFSGYPLTESLDDQTGIQYMACIINIVKSSIAPWNSIQKATRDDIITKLREKIIEILSSRKDIYEMYLKEREYRLHHSDEFEIPIEHKLEKWYGLYPPVVEIKVLESLPIERNNQINLSISFAEGQILRYGCGVIESIHNIVQSKDVLLKTALGIPFVQNTCCNETQDQRALTYFIREKPAIATFMKHIDYYGNFIRNQIHNARSLTWTSTMDTRIARHTTLSGNLEEIIYHSFIHHCKFDRFDAEIPDFLRGICAMKPSEDKYNHRGTLREKIQALKESGKVFHIEDFERLLRYVNASNLISPNIRIVAPSAVNLLTDFLSATSASSSPILDPIRKEFLSILIKYDPQVMINEKKALLLRYDPELLRIGSPEEHEELHVAVMKFKNKLAKLNETMRIRITNFIKIYSGLKRADLTNIQSTIETIGTWVEYKTVHNNITAMVKVIPEMILNQNMHGEEMRLQHNHWGLSPIHTQTLQELVSNYWSDYAKFCTEDSSFKELLRGIQGRLSDVLILLRDFPIQQTIHRGGEDWFRLLDRSTTMLFISYLWYSVFDQYIALSTDLFPKNTYVQTVEEIKKRVAGLLVAYLRTSERDNHDINQSYETIMKKVNRAKDKEKEKIMRTFEQADKHDRRYMFLEKMWKLGKWNVGIQNGLVRYDKERFEMEMLEDDSDMDSVEGGRPDDEDLFDEGDNILGLSEDYMDGDEDYVEES